MIEGLKPYAEYKESGVPWLGRCPNHWKLKRIKILFHERVEKGFPDEPLLAATQSKGVVKKEDYETRTVTAQKDLHLLKLVEVGDYVISLRSFQGGIEYSHCRGIISPAYTVLNPSMEAEGGFYTHFFKSWSFIDSLTLFVTGIREGQNIDYERLSRAELPLPPKDEQVAIVRFLDHANRKIDRFIRDKRRLIELLNEQKQAIIHRAVTRGLDPNVRLKPSGIEWLGDVPEHWEYNAIKRNYMIQLGKMLQNRPNGPDDVEIPYLKAQHIQWFSVRTTNAPKMWANPREIEQFGIHRGDLLVCEGGEGGRCCLVADVEPGYIIQNALHRVRPMNHSRNEYLQYVMSAISTIGWFEAINNKATIAHFTKEKFGSLRIPFPPLPEQAAIVEYLDNSFAEIDAIIDRARREIDLLREFRSRLISDVVTGKLDVRGVELSAMYEAETPEDIDIGEDIETEELIESEEVADADE
jgi:type I restriction enzyme S subunit